jgi:hypothetical protein
VRVTGAFCPITIPAVRNTLAESPVLRTVRRLIVLGRVISISTLGGQGIHAVYGTGNSIPLPWAGMSMTKG